MDGQAERRKQVATGRDTPATEPGHLHARPPPSHPPRDRRPSLSPRCGWQELEKLKRGKREHAEERAAVLRRLEEDKKERAEKFATHHALAQQAATAHGPSPA